ncbi:hypothetical protein BDV09DRAFT_199085 [Aspergillus tetrazonus]
MTVTASSSPTPAIDSIVEKQNDTGGRPGNESELVALSPTSKEEGKEISITAAIIILPTTLVYFLLMLDGSIIFVAIPAIPAIITEFDSLLDIGWYGGAYQLASSAFQPLSGKIYTCFMVLSSLLRVRTGLCGAAQSSNMLIVDRAIAGLGSPGLINGALTIIAAILPPHRQPIVMDWDRSVSRVAH